VYWKGDKFVKWKKVLGLNKWDVEDDHCLFLQAMNEWHVQLVEVSRFMDKVVEFVVAGGHL
jgi:hypothetical protein